MLRLRGFRQSYEVKEYWNALASFQKFYPCAKKFVYNLNLTEESLYSFEELKDVTILTDAINMTGHNNFTGIERYVYRAAKIFKPPMLLGFIDGYKHFHDCQVVFYADTSITLTQRFTTAAFNELHRQCIVVHLPHKVSKCCMLCYF